MRYVGRILRWILLDKVNSSGTDEVPSILRPRYEVIGPHNLKQPVKRLLSIWWRHCSFDLKTVQLVLLIFHAALRVSVPPGEDSKRQQDEKHSQAV